MLHLLKIFLISCYVVGPSHASSIDVENRIIRGQIVAARNYPYYIFLKLGSKVCGGALINPVYVLTAARCLENVHIDNMSAYTVFNNINQKRPYYSIEWYMIHPNFQEQPNKYNVAIMRLNQTVTNDNVKSIQLASRPPANGTEVGIVGYGAWRCNPGKQNCNKTSNRLRFTKTSIIRDFPYPLLVAKNNAGRSVCTGDAGGPVFYDNTLVAIISHSQPDCTGLNYFVRVDSQSGVLRPLGVAKPQAYKPGIGRSKLDDESAEIDFEENDEDLQVE